MPSHGSSPNGGYTPPPPPPGRTFAGSGGSDFYRTDNGIRSVPVLQKTKSISYGTSDEIYSITTTAAVDSPSGIIPNRIEIVNNGPVPVVIMTGYKIYTDETTIADTGKTRYFHTLLMPGNNYYPEIRGVISNVEATIQFDGTALENDAPSDINSGLLWYDTGANLAADVDATTNPITITTDANHTNYFRQGDLIQIGRGTTQADLEEANHYREILRVQSITNTTTMVCERALYGTDAGDNDLANWNQGHTLGFPIFLPFFNAYHDVDKYSVCQTDDNGRFKSYNFFGLGRASGVPQGLIPGSIALKFYQPGYQELGLTGITSATHSGLAAETNYAFDIQVDSGTNFDNLTFETDSSNLNFGGTSGIISKIQSALNTQYYTAGNLFEKKVTVGIVGGDIRFTSGSNLSTSAIAITAEDGSDASFLGTGRIPAVGNIDAAVAAKLPDDVVYDPITYATTPANVFAYDDGYGRIRGVATGTCCYERGMIDFIGPPNAEFVYSVSHTSAFSGKLTDASTTRGGALVNILANCPTQKRDASVIMRIF